MASVLFKRKELLFVENEKGCHICISHKTRVNGYVRLFIKGKHVLGHRYTFEQKYGPIPKNMCVRHRCDNRECINPEHLELGTIAENNNDTRARGRFVKVFGKHNGAARLSDEEVKMIKILLNTTESSYRSIAKQFGVSHITISNISRGIYRSKS